MRWVNLLGVRVKEPSSLKSLVYCSLLSRVLTLLEIGKDCLLFNFCLFEIFKKF